VSPTCVIRLTFVLPLLLSPSIASSQYLEPPAAVARILDAPLTPVVSLSPDRQWMLLMERPSLPGIAEVAAPDFRLAGIRLNPHTNGPTRSASYTGLVLRQVNGTAEQRVQSPAGGRLGNVQWSPDGSRVAFSVTGDDGIALWVAETASGQARQVMGPRLNGATGQPCSWLSSSDRLVCRIVPDGRGPAPARAVVPKGPVIQESEGRAAPNRTYQDLLESPADELLFDHYFTSRIVMVALDGSATPIGATGVYLDADPSPDGRYLLVRTVHRPYSYLVPINRFPIRMEVWDLEGNVVRLLADRGLQEEVSPSFDAVTTGPRDLEWRADLPATLTWTEALDGGNPRQSATKRDEVRMLAAPFAGMPQALASVEWRVRSVRWTPRGQALVEESWNRTSRTRTWLVDPAGAARLVFDRSSEDRYGDPGDFLMIATPAGTRVVQTTRDGKSVFLAGAGASPDGDRPFLDRMELTTGKVTRLWRSEAPHYEEVVGLVDPARGVVITERESVDEPPNYFLRDIPGKRLVQVTRFADPAPEFAGISKELITYTRSDGVQLSATLYLPPGYRREQGPLPFFFWAYPREFRSADAAAQVIGSPYRFTRPTGASHLFLLLAGYGVLDNPTMPIVAQAGKESNDTYVEQLVASAQAAVDKVVEMGLADRARIGIGGHSYGAFMTANLLAHSDLFRAGIARSGAYNRTLTPFGFQAEERTYWEAGDTYTRMSPFTYANQIKEPILLIHGQDDDNSGTFPIQSERFYAALKGNGAKARLVFLPGEAHGYRARESVGHTLAEMINWMDTYVKPGGQRALTP
jgi:dipeptidyl aminopeptidase/acylaminoacyl peptidase